MTNDINPAFNIGAASSAAVYTGTLANHTANPVFMKPNAFAGDNGSLSSASGRLDSGLRFNSIKGAAAHAAAPSSRLWALGFRL